MSFGEQIYRHSTYSSAKSWRERAGRYRLEGSKCVACGNTYFPRRVSCPSCQGRALVPYQCAHTGTVIVGWPQIGLLRLMGYADLPQRFVAIVRLDDGTHIETELVDISEEQVNENQAGLRVRLVFRKIRRESNGNWCYGYKFSPTDGIAGELPGSAG